MCPMDHKGIKPWQQAIIDAANDSEDVVVFGGNIATFSRKHCQELKQIIADGQHRPCIWNNSGANCGRFFGYCPRCLAVHPAPYRG
jgi:hypothetical protein